jgi:hypothetical protein
MYINRKAVVPALTLRSSFICFNLPKRLTLITRFEDVFLLTIWLREVASKSLARHFASFVKLSISGTDRNSPFPKRVSMSMLRLHAQSYKNFMASKLAASVVAWFPLLRNIEVMYTVGVNNGIPSSLLTKTGYRSPFTKMTVLS